MPFIPLGYTSQLGDVIKARGNDVATINNLEQNKVNGRDRTAGAYARAVPSSHSDLQQGDAVGDFLNDGTHEYRLLLMSDGSKKWNKHTLNVSW